MEPETPPSGDDPASIRLALRDGLNAMALDRVRDAVQAPGDRASAELLYLGALALARMGAAADAERWLGRLAATPVTEAALALEVDSLAGRLAKDRYVAAVAAGKPEAARAQAAIALQRYRRAFEISGSPYPAVNAASMAWVIGDSALSRGLAERALAAGEGDGGGDGHWPHATRGEALLLLGRVEEARREYASARARAGQAFGDIASMRRQLRVIGSPAALQMLEILPAPAVIAFSGHMIDAPERLSARFPPALEDAVRTVLREKIASYGDSIGFAQAACGSDILFLEAMQDAGMQTHVVLPCASQDFLASSVRFAGEHWVRRFEQVLARATSSALATEEPLLGDDVLFEHASNLILGMAMLRAAELGTQPLLLTVRDPGGSRHDGGTAATAEAWRARGRRVDEIDLATLRGTPPDAGGREPVRRVKDRAGRGLKSLLFADIQGFSRLPEQYTPKFADLFLGTCKRLIDGLERKPIDANTRGDGIFLVFDRAGDAAQFAVRLLEAFAGVDWAALALPAETSARIGLHTGPVFRTYDPVMGKPTYYGTHVNRTARLEPVVQPGHVFVTEAFAASLVAEEDGRFHCHYLGELPLAKAFGDARLYRLVSAADDR